MTISWLCKTMLYHGDIHLLASDPILLRDSFSDSSLTLSRTSGYPCLPIRSLQPLAKAFCTDLTVQGLGSQVKVFLGQTKAWLNLCQRIAQCNPLKPLPVTSITHIYTYNTKHCYCLHCGFPAIQPAQTIASCHTILPYDLSNGLRMSLANANKQRLELTFLVALQSSNWRWIAWSASPEHQRMWLISRLELYDIWFCWGYECYPDIQALVKVTSPSEGLSFQDTTIQPHKLLLFCLYLVIWMCCIVGIIESLLCCIVLWSSVLYPLRHGIMASPLGQGMAPA